ncbi:unnamed protein product [Ascophyllum nodosum]
MYHQPYTRSPKDTSSAINLHHPRGTNLKVLTFRFGVNGSLQTLYCTLLRRGWSSTSLWGLPRKR